MSRAQEQSEYRQSSASTMESMLSYIKLGSPESPIDFTTADELMPAGQHSVEATPPRKKLLQPPISFEKLEGLRSTNSLQRRERPAPVRISEGSSVSAASQNSWDADMRHSVHSESSDGAISVDSTISQRKSSLAVIKVAPLKVKRSPAGKSLPTSPESQRSPSTLTHQSTPPSSSSAKTPVTPQSEFSPLNLVIEKTESENFYRYLAPSTPSSDNSLSHGRGSGVRHDYRKNSDDHVGTTYNERSRRAYRDHRHDNSVDSTDQSLSSFQSASSMQSTAASLRLSGFACDKDMERMRRRHNCVRELYNTEWLFAQDMAVIVRIYMCGSADLGLSMRQIDNLFSNVTHMMDLSLGIVAILESQIPAQILHGDGSIGPLDILADRELHVGRGMCLALTGQFYEVYETYIHRNKQQMELCYQLTQSGKCGCASKGSPRNSPTKTTFSDSRNSRASAANLGAGTPKKLAHNPIDPKRLEQWLQRSRRRAEKFTTAWSLDSLLIKPIQRLGKYPLFLNTLLESSNPEHDDYVDLHKALKRSVHYMDCINARYDPTNP